MIEVYKNCIQNRWVCVGFEALRVVMMQKFVFLDMSYLLLAGFLLCLFFDPDNGGDVFL
jgi:hypothetical protein